MKLYGFSRSRALRAVWAAEEAGVDYTFVPVDAAQGGLSDPAFLALNPAGKVPVLVDGDLVLTESAAIATWLADQAPTRALVPPHGTAQRARYLQWCFFVVTELEQALWVINKHKFVLPKALRVDVRPAALHEWARYAKVLEAGLVGQPYLCGAQFTMADLLAAHTLIWAKSMKIELSEPLAAWLVTQKQRPALARAIARENAAQG
jgi:glutathione S-transferase